MLALRTHARLGSKFRAEFPSPVPLVFLKSCFMSCMEMCSKERQGSIWMQSGTFVSQHRRIPTRPLSFRLRLLRCVWSAHNAEENSPLHGVTACKNQIGPNQPLSTHTQDDGFWQAASASITVSTTRSCDRRCGRDQTLQAHMALSRKSHREMFEHFGPRWPTRASEKRG